MSDNTAVIRWLGNIQNVSAIIGATFLGVHLAAPLAAAVGGEHAATQTMVRRLGGVMAAHGLN
jgi:hypothetical protein